MFAGLGALTLTVGGVNIFCGGVDLLFKLGLLILFLTVWQ